VFCSSRLYTTYTCILHSRGRISWFGCRFLGSRSRALLHWPKSASFFRQKREGYLTSINSLAVNTYILIQIENYTSYLLTQFFLACMLPGKSASHRKPKFGSSAAAIRNISSSNPRTLMLLVERSDGGVMLRRINKPANLTRNPAQRHQNYVTFTVNNELSNPH